MKSGNDKSLETWIWEDESLSGACSGSSSESTGWFGYEHTELPLPNSYQFVVKT
jgi:hypothetical protein